MREKWRSSLACASVCVTCPGYPGHHLQLQPIKLAQVHQKLKRWLKIARSFYRVSLSRSKDEGYFHGWKQWDLEFFMHKWSISEEDPHPDLPRQPQSYCHHSHLVSCHFHINCILFSSHFVFSLHLVHLQGVSPPPPSPSSYGKVNEYLFQRQEQREAASGQKHPSPPLPSPPLPLRRDPCCLDASEWRSSGGWLRAKHAVALPQQFKQWRAALFLQLCRQPASAATCSNLIPRGSKRACRFWVEIESLWLQLVKTYLMKKMHRHHWSSDLDPHRGAANCSERQSENSLVEKRTAVIFIGWLYGSSTTLIPLPKRWKSKSPSPPAQLILSFCRIMQLSVHSFSPWRLMDVSVSAYRRKINRANRS